MSPLVSSDRLAELLEPYLQHASINPAPDLLAKLSTYLDLLVRWNARTNLTAIREPEEIVTRHFGESLFAATYVPGSGSLLDFGSGAGFPGIPMQLLHPELRVTLAESQGKKASFLQEVKRSLDLGFEVWPARAEKLPDSRIFDSVALRAVDNMPEALRLAGEKVAVSVYVLTSKDEADLVRAALSLFTCSLVSIPDGSSRVLISASRKPKS